MPAAAAPLPFTGRKYPMHDAGGTAPCARGLDNIPSTARPARRTGASISKRQSADRDRAEWHGRRSRSVKMQCC